MSTSGTRVWVCLLGVAGLAGCASAPPPGGENDRAPERYADALSALERGERALGRSELIRVLVAGGYDGNGAVGSAEIYEPVGRAWSGAGAMALARSRGKK